MAQALQASPGPRLQAALETLSADVVAVAPSEVVQRCCDTVTSQGVVALVHRPALPLPPTMQTVLICDGIQDPGEDCNNGLVLSPKYFFFIFLLHLMYR